MRVVDMTIAPESGCMDAEVAGHGSGKMIDRSLGEAIALSLTDGALPGETDGLDDAARAEAAAFVAATAAGSNRSAAKACDAGCGSRSSTTTCRS
jgi:hypothetical protein